MDKKVVEKENSTHPADSIPISPTAKDKDELSSYYDSLFAKIDTKTLIGKREAVEKQFLIGGGLPVSPDIFYRPIKDHSILHWHWRRHRHPTRMDR